MAIELLQEIQAFLRSNSITHSYIDTSDSSELTLEWWSAGHYHSLAIWADDYHSNYTVNRCGIFSRKHTFTSLDELSEQYRSIFL